jgi:hypothetical protein
MRESRRSPPCAFPLTACYASMTGRAFIVAYVVKLPRSRLPARNNLIRQESPSYPSSYTTIPNALEADLLLSVGPAWVRSTLYRSHSVAGLEEPSQVRSMDRMYSRGATLRVRLNNVLKAAGLSYPRSAAVSVTDAPAVSFGSAARMHACCRHATKLSPVSRRNNRVNVRRVRCSESAQSSIFAFAFGDAENLRQRRARALCVGNGRERGNSRSRPTSYPMSFIMAAERPSRSYSIGKATASAMRLRISEEMATTRHRSGISGNTAVSK